MPALPDVNIVTYPKNVTLSYVKNSSVVPSSTIEFRGGSTTESQSASIASNPNWIKPVYMEADENDNPNVLWKYKIMVDEENANTLSNGTHTTTLKFNVRSGSNFGVINVHVSLDVSGEQELDVFPSSFSKSYTPGDANPSDSELHINTDRDWSATSDQSWLTLSDTSGSGNAVINLQVDAASLSEGSHTAEIEVYDGRKTKRAVYVLEVGEAAAPDFISVQPSAVHFSEHFEATPNSTRVVTVSSSEDVDINTDTPWLSVDETELTAGDGEFTIIVVDSEELTIGTHSGSVKINSDASSARVDVVLMITQDDISGVDSNLFCFAHERHKAEMSTALSDQEALFYFEVQSGGRTDRFEKKVPYFQNQLSFVIGLENEILMQPTVLPQEWISKFYNLLAPTRWSFEISDREMGRSDTTFRRFYTNLKFINGRNPKSALAGDFPTDDISKLEYEEDFNPGDSITNVIPVTEVEKAHFRLTYLPLQMAVPADAVLSLAHLWIDDSSRPANIFISGDVEDEVEASGVENDLYFGALNLKDYDLLPNDSIFIESGIISAKIQIKPTQMRTSKIIWENEWGFPEIYNATGEVRMRRISDQSTTELWKDGREFEQILNTKRPYEYQINTGNVFYDAEMDFLSTMFDSKKVWIEINGKRIEVVPTDNGLDTFRTRENIKDYTLKFKSVKK